MNTFGELITQVKRQHHLLCKELAKPGAAHYLGPGYAYGRAFYIQNLLSKFAKAIETQEVAASNNEQHLWRVIDSVRQALSMIEQYRENPVNINDHGLADKINREALNCGFTFSENEASIQVCGVRFLLDISFPDTAKLEYECNQEFLSQLIPELFEYIETDDLSNLFLMASRLDTLGKEEYCFDSFYSAPIIGSPFLGGIRFPLTKRSHAFVTLDKFEPAKSTLAVVLMPPIIFPMETIIDLSNKCGQLLKVNNNARSTVMAILETSKIVKRTLGSIPTVIDLHDNQDYPVISLARIPIETLDRFEGTIELLRQAALWTEELQLIMSETEEISCQNTLHIIPLKNFGVSITAWKGSSPEAIEVSITPEMSLHTNSDDLNKRLNGDSTLLDILREFIEH